MSSGILFCINNINYKELFIIFGLHVARGLNERGDPHDIEHVLLKDPIVQDVRKAGEELAKQADYDLRIFFQNLRNNEKKWNYKVVSRLKR